MKPTYILGMDAAKHKVRAALRGAEEAERFLYEKDLTGRRVERRARATRKKNRADTYQATKKRYPN